MVYINPIMGGTMRAAIDSSMAGGVKRGRGMVLMMFEGTNPSCVAHDQKEDRLAWTLAMVLGASLILPLGAIPSGSET